MANRVLRNRVWIGVNWLSHIGPDSFFYSLLFCAIGCSTSALANDEQVANESERNAIAFQCFERMPFERYPLQNRRRVEWFLRNWSGDESPDGDRLLQWAVEHVLTELDQLAGLRADTANSDANVNFEVEWFRLSERECELKCGAQQAIGIENVPDHATRPMPISALQDIAETSEDCAVAIRSFARALLLGGDKTQSRILADELASHLELDSLENCQTELIKLALSSPEAEFRSRIVASVVAKDESRFGRVLLDAILSSPSNRRCGVASGDIVTILRSMPLGDFTSATRKWSGTLEHNESVMNLAFDPDVEIEKRAALVVNLADNGGFAQRILNSSDQMLVLALCKAELTGRKQVLPPDFDFESMMHDAGVSDEQKRLIVQIIGRRAGPYSSNSRLWRKRLGTLTDSSVEVVREEARKQSTVIGELAKKSIQHHHELFRESELRLVEQISATMSRLHELEMKPIAKRTDRENELIGTLQFQTLAGEVSLIEATLKRLYLNYEDANADMSWRQFLQQERDQLEMHNCVFHVVASSDEILLGRLSTSAVSGFVDCKSRLYEQLDSDYVLMREFVFLVFDDGDAKTIQYPKLLEVWNLAMAKRKAKGEPIVELPKPLIEKCEKLPLLE